MPVNPQWQIDLRPPSLLPPTPARDNLDETKRAVARMETIVMQMWTDIAMQTELLRQICRHLSGPGH